MPTLQIAFRQLASAGAAGALLVACGDPGGGGVFGNSGSGGSSDVTSLFAGSGGGGDGGAPSTSNASSTGSPSSPAATSTGPGGNAQSSVASPSSASVTSSSGGCIPGDEYACLNGVQCIPTGWQCDGFADCSDGSDEAPLNFACSGVTSVAASSSSGGCQVPCGGDAEECVFPSDICDGQDDCDNHSDERGCEVGPWTCPEAYYGGDDGCDCGCGTRDPDCISAGADACEYCNGVGACSVECTQIRDDQNWRCDEDG